MNQNQKYCDRQHEEGQDKLVAICLNQHCDKRLMCCFCYHDFHSEHVKDVKTISQLQQLCKSSIEKFDQLQLSSLLQQKAHNFKTVVNSIQIQINRLQELFLEDLTQIFTMIEELADSYVVLQQGNINHLTNDQCELLCTFKDERLLDQIEEISNNIEDKHSLQKLIQISHDLEHSLQFLELDLILERNLTNEKMKQFIKEHSINYDWIQPQFLLIRSSDIQKIEYENENFYIGEIKDGKRYGRGLLFNKIPQTFQHGVFYDDIFVWGQSVCVDSKKKYWIKQGKMKNEKIDGKGIQTVFNGEMYQGDLRCDIRDGFGIMKYTSGDEYQGQWKMGLFHGKGLYKYSNGDEYEGNYFNDKKQGIGSFQCKNGELYVGQFEQGLRNGSAIVKFQNGDLYTGEYVNDKKEGPGVYKYINGDIFEGQYKNGLRNGNGIFTDQENQLREIGNYIDGKQNGEHMVFKLLSDKPLYINIYDNGKIIEKKVF